MPLELKLVDWVWTIAIGWVGYVHYQLRDKPSIREMELQQYVNDERHREIKRSLQEHKDDLTRLESKLDRLTELLSHPTVKH